MSLFLAFSESVSLVNCAKSFEVIGFCPFNPQVTLTIVRESERIPKSVAERIVRDTLQRLNRPTRPGRLSGGAARAIVDDVTLQVAQAPADDTASACADEWSSKKMGTEWFEHLMHVADEHCSAPPLRAVILRMKNAWAVHAAATARDAALLRRVEDMRKRSVPGEQAAGSAAKRQRKMHIRDLTGAENDAMKKKHRRKELVLQVKSPAGRQVLLRGMKKYHPALMEDRRGAKSIRSTTLQAFLKHRNVPLPERRGMSEPKWKEDVRILAYEHIQTLNAEAEPGGVLLLDEIPAAAVPVLRDRRGMGRTELL